ncbi:hypothetical protein EYF80_041218 [Liparis tanakae]|uniref:Uncharacterized protein n=1 Tax=Liparis tanakae TaxID=230148 RepID=A0A4Z2G4R1_9TELE|nr:hypothetical protein EYF80_041218 [Liparis tanakae]
MQLREEVRTPSPLLQHPSSRVHVQLQHVEHPRVPLCASDELLQVSPEGEVQRRHELQEIDCVVLRKRKKGRSDASPVGSTPKKLLNSCRKRSPLGHSVTNFLYISWMAWTSISLLAVGCVCPMAAWNLLGTDSTSEGLDLEMGISSC